MTDEARSAEGEGGSWRTRSADLFSAIAVRFRQFWNSYESIWSNTLTSILPWVGIITLSIASFVTTIFGIQEYTDSGAVALFGTLGIQVVMVYASAGIGRLPHFRTPKLWWLGLSFAIAMAISSFFSFAAFHTIIENEERRSAASVTLIRSQWTRVFNDIRLQLSEEFRQVLRDMRRRGADTFADWRQEHEKVQSQALRFVREYEPVISSRMQRLDPQSERERESARLEVEEEIARVARDRRSDAGRRDQARERVLVLQSEVENLAVLLDREVSEGGTRLEDGSLTRAGRGPQAREYENALRDAEFGLLQAKSDLSAAQARLQVAQDRETRLRSELQSLLGTDEQGVRRGQLEAARGSLDSLGEAVQSFRPITSNLEFSNTDALLELGSQIDSGVRSCLQAKERFRAAQAALRAAGISADSVPSYQILEADCDVAPAFGDGGNLAEQIGELAEFLSECAPNRLAPTADRAIDAGLPTPGTDGAVQPLISATQTYAASFDALSRELNRCLGKAPVVRSDDALIRIMSDFQRLLLTYDPKAHQFTRAAAAFDRGDLTAYLAAGIAAAIDFMILVCGLTMRRFDEVEELGPDDLDDRTAEIEQELEDFVVVNRHLVRSIIIAVTPVTKESDGVVEVLYECKFPRPTIDSRLSDLIQLQDLGIINLNEDGFSMTPDKYAKLRQISREYELL